MVESRLFVLNESPLLRFYYLNQKPYWLLIKTKLTSFSSAVQEASARTELRHIQADGIVIIVV